MKAIHVSDINLEESFDKNILLLETFSKQALERFENEHGISTNFTLDKGTTYEGDSDKVQRKLDFEKAQNPKIKRLKELKEEAAKLEREIVQNCRSLEEITGF